ncbi:hypothetical protein A3J41_03130 [candidate division TM6 bacterium RIFCSPHIGHO2_12_FULL_38_8]|nr:MAG: hypothetical protein A3J41_03130 [candidate division TM6 bacterium RIFCSPHIGHO2_12_FULL_38_8]
MKKNIILIYFVLYSCASSLLADTCAIAVPQALTFTIAVPQEFLGQDSSLMVYMIDQAGCQHVGKCQVDSCSAKDIQILQNQLEITTLQEAEHFDTVVDLMTRQETLGQDVVMLHFEFDHEIQVLRVLVVKNSFLEDNPFDVLTLSLKEAKEFDQNHHTFKEFEDDMDALTKLVDNVDCAVMEQAIQQQDQQASRLKQYMLYAEIYMLMQYGRMKRAMHGVTSWLCS